MMNRSLVAAILTIASVPALAQWLNVPTKGIPRTKDGKPDLSAPAPRKPDGKPDLSGVWELSRDSFKYLRDLASDFKPGDLPIQAWAEALTKERIATNGSEDPRARCLPQGIPILDAEGAFGSPTRLVQEPDLVVVLYEIGRSRQIYLDGRRLAPDSNPTWMGYSTGRWDKDALVVESTGFNGKMWLDMAGHPTTEALHITERFRRPDFGHLELTLTIDDPKAYTKPWAVTETLELSLDTDLLEYVCNENEKDLNHIVGK
jgi:hypothetical protein